MLLFCHKERLLFMDNEIIERKMGLGWTESQKFEKQDRNQSRR